jgi:F-type H+-transporting ATPase subunit delta
MDIPAVARRYAQAFYDLSVEEGVVDAVRADLAAIRELIANVPEFSGFIDNPTIPPKTVDEAVENLFKDRAHPATLRFIRFLAAKGRLGQLRAVCDVYEQQVCAELGILKVKITAAHELSNAQLEAMKAKLQVQHGRTIVADVEVDASLIGGFKIQEGDRIRDFSLLAKLNQFEQSVIHAKHDHPKYKATSWR